MSDLQTPPEIKDYAEKPGMVQAIAVMTLVNGILNILYALGVTMLIIIGSLGIGIVCTPLTILPGILGIFEILYAIKLLPDTPQPTQPNHILPILEICAILTGNIISLVIGILNMVFYNDDNVKTYFTNLNA